MSADGRLFMAPGDVEYIQSNQQLIRGNDDILYFFCIEDDGAFDNVSVNKADAVGIPTGPPPPPYNPMTDKFPEPLANLSVNNLLKPPGVAAVLDPTTGLFHIFYKNLDQGFTPPYKPRLWHNTYDPVGNAWGTEEVVSDVMDDAGDSRFVNGGDLCVTIDDNDDLHVCYSTDSKPRYLNRIAGIGGGAETTARGSLQLRAGSGWDVSSVTVDGVEVLSGTVSWAGNLGAMAEAIKDNINAHTSSPNYRAVHGGNFDFYTMIYPVIQGSGPNGFVVDHVKTGDDADITDRNLEGGGVDMWTNEAIEVYDGVGVSDIIIGHPTTAIGADRPILFGGPDGGGAFNELWHGNALNATSFTPTGAINKRPSADISKDQRQH